MRTHLLCTAFKLTRITSSIHRMSPTDRYIEPSEVQRHKDGRIDLFSTILARKDPSAQIPVLYNTRLTTSVSQPSPASDPARSIHQQRQHPSSAPHATDSAPSLESQRKRHQSRSPSPAHDSANKMIKADESVKVAQREEASPVPSVANESSRHPRNVESASGASRSWGGRAFERIFIGYCTRPSTIPPEIVYWYDDNHVILKDAYPKAKIHMLVLPRKNINNVTELSGPEGIDIVDQLVERANWLLESLKNESPLLEFKMGFHAIPSILRLHLHVISQDFCSEALKTKHHWNSFTTPFFIPPEEVISTIQAKGTFPKTPEQRAGYEALLKRDLQCNQCAEKPKNMPALRKHLQEHYLRRANKI